MNETTKYRVELYEIIGEGGRYFHVTREASTKEKAIKAVRETYPAYAYRLASVEALDTNTKAV